MIASQNSISSRLYGKFHQEACMHYGREFLSVAMWDSEKAQHLRETCARVSVSISYHLSFVLKLRFSRMNRPSAVGAWVPVRSAATFPHYARILPSSFHPTSAPFRMRRGLSKARSNPSRPTSPVLNSRLASHIRLTISPFL